MTWVNKYLTTEDLTEIENAVIRAEKKTSGEIVPVLIRQSASYFHIPFVLFLALTIAFKGLHVPLYPLAALVAAVLLSQIRFVRSALSWREDISRQVNQRAELEFFRSRINQTQAQTGILLFLSFEERQAVVLADAGINQHCKEETWNEIINILTSSIRAGKLKDGIVKAVEQCDEILAPKFPKKEFDTDELSNKLVIKEN